MPVANTCLRNALHGFKMAKENPNVTILNSRDEVKNKSIKKALIDYKVPENSKGIYYGINSNESNKIAESNTIQMFIYENYDKLINNTIPKEIVISFEKESDKDIYYAIHGCKLVNPKITTDGYFEATIVDYYDFKYREPKNEFDLANKINNAGYRLQEKGYIDNYFNIYYISKKLW